MFDVKNKIITKKIIAIIRGIEEYKILKTIDSLVEGGIELLEITLNQDSEEKCLKTIKLIQLVREKFVDVKKVVYCGI